MFSILPITSHLAARRYGYRSLADVASQQVQLAPAATILDPPATALADEWDRIEQFHPASDPEWEAKVIRGGAAEHPPTIGYRLEKAIVADGTLYAGAAYERINNKRRKAIIFGLEERFPEAQLCANSEVHNFFGHWLVDGLHLELLAEQRGLPALSIPRVAWSHEPGYRALTGLQEIAPKIASVDVLWAIDDRGMNRSRHSRMRELRRRSSCEVKAGPKRVFLDRGVLGAERNLINRNFIVTTLKDAGFVEVYPERETPARLAELLSCAEVCVGVEGSSLTHATLLMPDGATLIALQPPRRFTSIVKLYANCANMNYAYSVGQQQELGFTIDAARLLKTIDLCSVI